MTNEERIKLIEEAKDLIFEAMGLVDEAVKNTDIEGHYNAYGKYGFERLLNTGNPYDSGLENLIEAFRKKERDE